MQPISTYLLMSIYRKSVLLILWKAILRCGFCIQRYWRQTEHTRKNHAFHSSFVICASEQQRDWYENARYQTRKHFEARLRQDNMRLFVVFLVAVILTTTLAGIIKYCFNLYLYYYYALLVNSPFLRMWQGQNVFKVLLKQIVTV